MLIHLLISRVYRIFTLAKSRIFFHSRYTLIETIDGRFGAKDKSTREWNGMVGMIVRRVGLTVS